MASSLAELEAEILAEFEAAAHEAAARMYADLQSEVSGYYTGTPKQYVRTGQLGNTPRLDPPGGGKSINFRVYLNQAGGYTTGCHPSMATVIRWTDGGGGGTIGYHGYWSRALKRMGTSFHSAFNSHFG